ncbi:uncharacterized protein [Spinacia oleracea]|uniref:Endonuclease/exonuclease/phosphatase domain-containing protein n=1 Tax=Spinacia oleracea TaxID=3562 RepID=A0ABM3RJM6_SPIOL|nr:uncharacterized protein LOC110778447 [Spinacia oleracea]
MICNVQGISNKLASLRELIRINKPTLLALVQTHISGDQAQIICDRIGFSGQLRVDAQGFSGGIWLFYRVEEVTVTLFDSHTQHLTVEIRRVGDEPWLFSAIYASPESSLRRELWSELENIRNRYSGPWLLACDFNETKSMEERNGPDHTWFRGNSSETFKSARLDRGLCNDAWRIRFEEGSLRNIPKLKSDHCPILISTTGFAPIPSTVRPFRFQAAWMNHAKFEEFVHVNWKSTEPLIPFLKVFADQLNEWNRLVFHNIDLRDCRILAKGRLTHLIKLEVALNKEMEDVLTQEEVLWFQKSRVDAIKDGDRNTRYFHLSTIIRRRQNKGEALKDNTGSWVYDAETDDWKLLTRPFEDCEIQRGLVGMKPFKAPGPDGFQPLFYQWCWKVVAPSLIKLVTDVLEGRTFLDGLNNAFLVLIPKVEAPHSPK